jgi:hypothetical protein
MAKPFTPPTYQGLAKEVLDFLSSKFEPQDVKWLPNTVMESKRQKGTYVALAFPYLTRETVIKRLNASGLAWSFTCSPTKLTDKHVVMAGILEITLPDGRVLRYGDFGEQEDNGGNSATLFKGANSDALKRCATFLEIGLYLSDKTLQKWKPCEVDRDQSGALRKDAKGKPKFRRWLDELDEEDDSAPVDNQPVERTRQAPEKTVPAKPVPPLLATPEQLARISDELMARDVPVEKVNNFLIKNRAKGTQDLLTGVADELINHLCKFPLKQKVAV